MTHRHGRKVQAWPYRERCPYAAVGAIEEQLVLQDGPARARAKLVEFRIRPWLSGGIQQELIGVKYFVLQILIGESVKGISPCFSIIVTVATSRYSAF